MRHEGEISLCNVVQTVMTAHYGSILARENIIKSWKRVYAEGFYHCWIDIFPYTLDDEINPDGTNTKRSVLTKTPKTEYPQRKNGKR